MGRAKNQLRDAVEEIERLMDFLSEHTKSDIDTQAVEFDVDEEFANPTSPFSSEENVERMQELHEDSLRAAAIAKSVPELIEECAELVVKHPRETKHLAEVLHRMHVEVSRK